MDQNVFIDQLETQLEQQLTEVVSTFQNLPEFVLLEPSSTGGWSICECVDHLNTYAEFYIPKLKKVLNQKSTTPVKVFNHTRIGRYFIRMMDSSGKKKYKAIRRHRPGSSKDPYEVLAEFIRHLEEMIILLKEAHEADLSRVFVSTSIMWFIRINAGDAFQFLLTHNQRHLIQARKNIPENTILF